METMKKRMCARSGCKKEATKKLTALTHPAYPAEVMVCDEDFEDLKRPKFGKVSMGYKVKE